MGLEDSGSRHSSDEPPKDVGGVEGEHDGGMELERFLPGGGKQVEQRQESKSADKEKCGCDQQEEKGGT